MKRKIFIIILLFLTFGIKEVSATVAKERFNGISYEIPSDWRKTEKENLLYYYPEDGMLMVSFVEIDASLSDDFTRENFLKGLSQSMEIKDEREETLKGVKGYSYSINSKAVGSGEAFFFDVPKGIIAFIMAEKSGTNADYSEEFSKIKNSISIGKISEGVNGWDESTKTFTSKEGVLKIDDIQLTEDYSGAPAAKIYFTLTNNAKEERNAMVLLSFMMTVQQRNSNTSNNLNVAILDWDTNEKDHLLDNILPGGTISGFYAVKLENLTDTLVLKFQEFFKPVAEYSVSIQ